MVLNWLSAVQWLLESACSLLTGSGIFPDVEIVIEFSDNSLAQASSLLGQKVRRW